MTESLLEIRSKATEGTSSSSTFVTYAGSFHRHTKVQDSRCEAYYIPYDRSAVPSQRTKFNRNQAAGPHGDRGILPSQRYAVNRLLAKAKQAATAMHEAALRAEPVQVAVSGCALFDQLRALWRLRHVREAAWKSLLNFLESAISKEEFERFTPDQCTAVIKVVDLLAGGAVDGEEVKRARLILRRAGLDPWKGLSPD